jgi:hypothetical protein
MKKIPKYRQKLKKNWKKTQRFVLANLENIDSPRLTNGLYLFLMVMALGYAILIWRAGATHENVVVTARPPAETPLAKRVGKMTTGYPIERMARHIARQDPQVAALMIGIAKKESNWGKFSPQKDGRDCFNYWGYRGEYNQTDSGYSCFDSPRQAVDEVSGRMNDLIAQNLDTPSELVVWKCGWDTDCAGTVSARKWVRDVNFYYRKLN